MDRSEDRVKVGTFSKQYSLHSGGGMEKLKDRKLSEKEITHQIRAYLKTIGVWHYKQWQGLGSLHGISDIIGIYKSRYLAIEVKIEKGELTEKQAEFLERVRREGGIAIVAHSVNEIINTLSMYQCELEKMRR